MRPPRLVEVEDAGAAPHERKRRLHEMEEARSIGGDCARKARRIRLKRRGGVGVDGAMNHLIQMSAGVPRRRAPWPRNLGAPDIGLNQMSARSRRVDGARLRRERIPHRCDRQGTHRPRRAQRLFAIASPMPLVPPVIRIDTIVSRTASRHCATTGNASSGRRIRLTGSGGRASPPTFSRAQPVSREDRIGDRCIFRELLLAVARRDVGLKLHAQADGSASAAACAQVRDCRRSGESCRRSCVFRRETPRCRRRS